MHLAFIFLTTLLPTWVQAHGLLKSVGGDNGRSVWSNFISSARSTDYWARQDSFSFVTAWAPTPCQSDYMACGAFSRGNVQPLNVKAGDVIDVLETFGYHPGVARFYLKAITPGAPPATGSEDLKNGWFLIGADVTAKNLLTGADQMHYLKIPQCIPSGSYLLRVELLAIHLYRSLQCFARCAEINIINNTPNAQPVSTFPTTRVPGHLVLDGNKIWWRGNSLDNGEVKPWTQNPPYINCPDVMTVDRRDLELAKKMWGNTQGYPGNQYDHNGNQYQWYPSDTERRNQRAQWKANVYPPVGPTTTVPTTTVPITTNVPVPPPPPPGYNWKCIRSCTDNGAYLFAGDLGNGVQCRGTDDFRCSWYQDAQCSTLQPLSTPPVDTKGVICSDFGGGWCREAQNQVSFNLPQTQCYQPVPPPPPPPPVPVVTTTTQVAPVVTTTTSTDSTAAPSSTALPPGWKCIRSCQDKGNYVRAASLSQNGKAYIGCMGPRQGKCSWYSDANCQIVAPNEFPAVTGGGNKCTNYNGFWCLEAARQLWWNQPQTLCAKK